MGCDESAGSTLRDVTDAVGLVPNERTLASACVGDRLLVQVMHKRMQLFSMDAALAQDQGGPWHSLRYETTCVHCLFCFSPFFLPFLRVYKCRAVQTQAELPPAQAGSCLFPHRLVLRWTWKQNLKQHR